MAGLGLQFLLEQVNFNAEDVAVESLLDDKTSLNSVVDANTDFQEHLLNPVVSPSEAYAVQKLVHLLDKQKKTESVSPSEVEKACAELQRALLRKVQELDLVNSRLVPKSPIPQVHSRARRSSVPVAKQLPCENCETSVVYPEITPEVASYLAEKDPSILPRLYNTLESVQARPNPPWNHTTSNILGSFQSMTSTSETFALHVSDLGRQQPETGNTSACPTMNHNKPHSSVGNKIVNHAPLTRTDSSSSASTLESEVCPPDAPLPKVLHKYPSDRITILFEKKSYLDGPKPSSSAPSRRLRRRNDSLDSNSYLDSSRSLSELSDASSPEFCRKQNGNHETASNLSGGSEKLETLSMVSDVSGYSEEMFRIKKLLLDPSSPVDLPKKLTKVVSSPKPPRQMAPNEWHRKYESLLHERENLQGQVEGLKEEVGTLHAERMQLRGRMVNIESLAKERSSVSTLSENEKEYYLGHISTLEEQMRKLQQRLDESVAQCETKELESKTWKNEIAELENSNETLRVCVEEFRLEGESKDGAILGLKQKIADLHVELQSTLQAKLKCESDSKSAHNEIESLYKSRDWYQQQLHLLQSARAKIQQELMASQANAITQKNVTERLRTENCHLNQQLADNQRRAVKEKEVLLRHLETIEADMLERESFVQQMQNDRGSVDDSLRTRVKKLEEEKMSQANLHFTVSDMEQQVSSLSANLSSKSAQLEEAIRSNDDLVRRLSVSQKIANDRELANEALENKVRELVVTVQHMRENLHQQEETLASLHASKLKSDLAISAANKEKLEVDETVSKLRSDFQRVSIAFQKMRSDLLVKENELAKCMQEKGTLLANANVANERINELAVAMKQYEDLEKKTSEMQSLEHDIVQLRYQNTDLTHKITDIVHERDRIVKEKEQLLCKLNDWELTRQQLNTLTHSHDNLLHEVERLQKEKTELEVVQRNGVINCNSEKEKELRQEISDQMQKNKKLLQVIDMLQAEKSSRQQTLEEKENHSRECESLNAKLHETSAKLQDANATINMLSENLKATEISRDNTVLKLEQKVCQLQQRITEVDTTADQSSVLLSRLRNLESELAEASRQKHELNIELQVSRREHHAMETELSEALGKSENLHNVQNSLEEQLQFVQANWERASQELSDIVRDRDRLLHEVGKLTELIHETEENFEKKSRRYESNIRVLLKKLKEHIRARKAAEKEAAVISASEDGKYSELTLELEKMKGKLIGLTESNSSLMMHTNHLEAGLMQKDNDMKDLRTQTKDLQNKLLQDSKKLEELKEIASEGKQTIKELRQQIFLEKRENSRLKKQIYSLQIGLDTANQVVDSKKHDLESLQIQLSANQQSFLSLQSDYQTVSSERDKYKADIVQLRNELETSHANDPLLADQLKTLGFHLHQKNQELASLQAQLHSSEERQNTEKERLNQSLCVSADEIQQLRSELEVVRQAKFGYQSQVTELRTALKKIVEQNKIASSTQDIPEFPAQYNEALVSQLMEKCSSVPQNKPLNDLKNCLNSLKQEMAVLQKHLIEKTESSGHPLPVLQQLDVSAGQATVQHTSVQDV